MGWLSNLAVIDSHCHLTYAPLLDQIDAVLARAAAAGVRAMVTVGTSIADTQAALALAAAHPVAHPTAGVHPHEAGKVTDGWVASLEELAAHPQVVAIGETGLDYHYDFADRAAQRRAFEVQIELSLRLRKPLIIHCREAHRDVVDMLAGYREPGRVVFHCFTGTTAEAEEILSRGFRISLTGVVTFKRSDELREVARRLPAETIMVETDSPYLSPEPLRSVKPNEPAHIVHTARRIAAERGLSEAEFESLTDANARAFFRLPSP